MEARVVAPFFDLKEGVDRKAGASFEATEARIEEINDAGYGVLVEPVERPARKAPARKPKAAAK